jgi:hypothetical protein
MGMQKSKRIVRAMKDRADAVRERVAIAARCG